MVEILIPITSLPVRECGLKLRLPLLTLILSLVTPCAGVWIEISYGTPAYINGNKVTPCAGVWIEIRLSRWSL